MPLLWGKTRCPVVTGWQDRIATKVVIAGGVGAAVGSVLGVLQQQPLVRMTATSTASYVLLAACFATLQDSSGRIQLYVSALATQLPFIQAGKARVLAVTNRERSMLVPDVPTTGEAGFPNLTFDAVLGFFGPQSMSAELRERISADVRAVGADPAVVARLAAIGLIARTNTPAELSAIVERERAAVSAVARNADAGQKR